MYHPGETNIKPILGLPALNIHSTDSHNAADIGYVGGGLQTSNHTLEFAVYAAQPAKQQNAQQKYESAGARKESSRSANGAYNSIY